MGVYIDMEMPKNCNVCFVKQACCPAIRKRLESKYQPYTWIPANYRHEDCPFVEVPPHGDLVDRDALLRSDNLETLYDALRYSPAFIPASEEGE